MFHWLWIFPLLIFWPLHGLFLLLIVIALLSLIFRRRHYYYDNHPYGWTMGAGAPPDRRKEALDILQSRYARGEVQRDEYLQKKKDLGG